MVLSLPDLNQFIDDGISFTLLALICHFPLNLFQHAVVNTAGIPGYTCKTIAMNIAFCFYRTI